MRNQLLFLVFFLFNLFLFKAQSTRLITVDDGLSNNIIYDIKQDNDGFLWFATENGLNKYDGYSFEHFKNNPNDSTTIASNVVRTILKDSEGNFWIGTKNGLCYFKSNYSGFINILNSHNGLDIKELEILDNGKLWFNTLGVAGVFNINSQDFKFISKDYNSFSLTANNEKIWLSDVNGNVKFATDNPFDLNDYDSDIGYRRQIHFGKFSKKLWITKKGLKHGKEVLLLPKLPNNIYSTKLLEIDENVILIGTNEGLYQYNHQNELLKKIKLTSNSNSLNQQIRSLFKDKDGNLWVGTLGGVFHIDYKNKYFEHTTLNQSNNVVMGLEASDNKLYVNLFGSGVYEYNVPTEKLKQLDYSRSKNKDELFVWDIKSDKNLLWLATNSGLICYDLVNRKSKNIHLKKGKEPFNSVFDLMNFDKNSMWIASHTGVHKISKTPPIESLFAKVDIITETNIQKIVVVKDEIFIATEGKGLLLFDRLKNTIKSIFTIDDKLFSIAIWDMVLDDEIIWLGTNEGLFKLKVNNPVLEETNVKNNIIFSIQKDDYNRLWLGSDKGLISYNIKTNFVDLFAKQEGVLNVEFNRRSKTQTKNGKFWFGGVNGLTHFYPSKIKENTTIPPVHITKLEVSLRDSSYTYNHRNTKVVLPYHQNTISLDFVALNYTNSSKNKYKYQLVGRDKNWVLDKGNRFSRYSDLDPGTYTFKVIASNNDGIWNTNGDELLIEITPPFWEKWWFKTIVILVLGLIMYSIYYIRVKRLLAVERMKLRIASDLHDEVGSGLSGIALTSDMLEQQYKQGEIRPQLLSRITKNARNLAATLDDIVWLINPEKESLEDFILKAKTLAKETLYNLDVQFVEEINDLDGKKILSADQKRNLFLFVKEVLNNIVKHAKANSVIFSLKLKSKNLVICIQDDGIGFNTTQKTGRNGIKSLHNRALALKGTLIIDSKDQKGTRVKLQIKIP